MKTMKRKFLVAAWLLIASTGLLFAQTATKSTTAKQVTQQSRINQGVQTNELTRAEVAKLEKEQKCIKIEKRLAKADGTVTPAERRFLRREQKRASKHIAKEKNDRQERIVK